MPWRISRITRRWNRDRRWLSHNGTHSTPAFCRWQEFTWNQPGGNSGLISLRVNILQLGMISKERKGIADEGIGQKE